MFGSIPRSTDGLMAAQPTADGAPADSTLVVAAQADPRAFAPLCERYVGPVYRYCYLRMGTREAAEDATSEVFLKALDGLHGYRGGTFAAWLFRIAHNTVVDAGRRSRPSEPMESAGEPVDGSPTPEEATVARDEVATLRAAMARLSEDQRAVLDLQMAGWSGEQIGAVLGRSRDAVKMLRYRAACRLKALLIPAERGFPGGAR